MEKNKHKNGKNDGIKAIAWKGTKFRNVTNSSYKILSKYVMGDKIKFFTYYVLKVV